MCDWEAVESWEKKGQTRFGKRQGVSRRIDKNRKGKGTGGVKSGISGNKSDDKNFSFKAKSRHGDVNEQFSSMKDTVSYKYTFTRIQAQLTQSFD